MAKKKVDKKDEQEHSRETLHKYRNRLTFIRNGREFIKQNDFVNATKHYNTYVGIIAEYKKVDEKKLSPAHFDPKDELAEMLLISHLYWDLSCVYDRTPKLRHEFEHALSQFVKFTMGKKYQIPNAGMVKRFIKTHKMFNKEKFEAAYKQLQIKTKKCYVATMCFGQDHPITENFRSIRPVLFEYRIGTKFIELYYRFSPKMVNFCERRPILGKILTSLIFRPILLGLSRFIKRA
jgi:hypothetical protein